MHICIQYKAFTNLFYQRGNKKRKKSQKGKNKLKGNEISREKKLKEFFTHCGVF